MKLYDLGFGLLIALVLLAGISIGNKTCACGESQPPDTTIEQIRSPAV